jgi:hypothetical protein
VIDSDIVCRHYESLRQEAIEDGRGLALFLSRGMIAWMEALSAFTPSQRTSSGVQDSPRPLSSDLVRLLADMVLACREVYDEQGNGNASFPIGLSLHPPVLPPPGVRRTGRARQYDLKRRAQALGWASDRIVVIDEDLGVSGATAERSGFQRLVADVGLGRGGIVMGLEGSRLARNSTDWHRLLEICALSDALILDEDGIYDPSAFNDRLLLGLKGHDERGGAPHAQSAALRRDAQQSPKG